MALVPAVVSVWALELEQVAELQSLALAVPVLVLVLALVLGLVLEQVLVQVLVPWHRKQSPAGILTISILLSVFSLSNLLYFIHSNSRRQVYILW